MLNRSGSRAAGARARRRTLVMALAETLEQRRLFAAPHVEQPPAYPAPGEPAGPDGHFHFENAPGQQVKVEFDQSVVLASNAMSLLNLTTGQTITELTQTDTEPGPTRTWDVGYADPNVWTGVLPRGNYELLLNADRVTSAAAGNEKLDGDRDGTGGDDYVSGFFFQPGDVNHDRVVDGADYGTLDQWYQFPGTAGFSNGDVNYDEVIDGADYGTLDAWYGTALPAPPDQANEVEAAAGRGFIDLYWNAPEDAFATDVFYLYRSEDAGDTWTLRHTVYDWRARSWRDDGPNHDGLEDGKKYSYRIRAFSNTDGLSYLSNKAWAVTNLPGPGEAPTASLIGESTLTLTWNDNTINETGFEIEQTGPNGVVTVIPVSGANGGETKSVPVIGLSAATGYSFRVRARTAAQDSAWSPALTVTTLAAGVPIAPSNTSAISGSWHSARVAWQDNSNNETGFTIEKLDAFGIWEVIGTTAVDVTSFDVTSGLTGSTEYTFRIKADGPGGSSGSTGGSGIAMASDTGGGGGDNVASVTTVEAYGKAFEQSLSYEDLQSPIHRTWGGAAVVAEDGSLVVGEADGAVTLTLGGLPDHAALVVTADVGGESPSISVDGAPLPGWTEDYAGPFWVNHTGNSVTITFDPGSTPWMEWSTPTVTVFLESPKIHIGAPLLTVDEEGEALIRATDHGLMTGIVRPWPKELTVNHWVNGDAFEAVSGNVTIPANGVGGVAGGVGIQKLKGLKKGSGELTMEDVASGVKSSPLNVAVEPHKLSPGYTGAFIGASGATEVELTLTKADGNPAPNRELNAGLAFGNTTGITTNGGSTDENGKFTASFDANKVGLGGWAVFRFGDAKDPYVDATSYVEIEEEAGVVFLDNGNQPVSLVSTPPGPTVTLKATVVGKSSGVPLAGVFVKGTVAAPPTCIWALNGTAAGTTDANGEVTLSFTLTDTMIPAHTATWCKITVELEGGAKDGKPGTCAVQVQNF